MLVMDDLGWADVGYHGSDFPSPNIDRLAKTQGVRLEKYYVQQVCSPTRSALMTGRLPFRIGTQWVTTLPPGSPAALPMDVPTLAEVLSAANYSTHAIGKWHLGYAKWANTPLGRGFDSYVGYLQGAEDYYNRTMGAETGGVNIPGFTGYDFWVNKTAALDRRGIYNLVDHEAEAERVIEQRNPSKPFFMYYAPQNIHEPLQMPPEKKYSDNCAHVQDSKMGPGRHILCTMLSRLDTTVLKLEKLLKEQGLWNNTLIWATTDNGGMLPHGIVDGAAGSASSNTPLRAGKGTLFEGGVRGVSFVTGGYLPESAYGKTVEGLLQHVDIPQTLASVAGTSIPNTDGFNVWDTVVEGKASPRTEVIVNLDTSEETKMFNAVNNKNYGGYGEFDALIQGKWKLIKGNSGMYDGWNTNDPYNISQPNASQVFVEVHDKSSLLNEKKKVWLFDLDADPTERQNLALANPEQVQKMLASITEYTKKENGYTNPGYNLPLPRSLPAAHNGTWAPFLGDKEEPEIPAKRPVFSAETMHYWTCL